MDIEFDFKGDPLGGVISNCKYNYSIDTGLTHLTVLHRGLLSITEAALFPQGS